MVFSVAYAEMRIKNTANSALPHLSLQPYTNFICTLLNRCFCSIGYQTRIPYTNTDPHGSAFIWLSPIRTYIGNTDLDLGASTLAKIITFYTDYEH